MSLELREVLKNLCCNNGWCYGLFWNVNRRNSMLLTIEDAFVEEKALIVINSMLQQVHMLGEGIVGEAAFTGKHQWMFSDTCYQYWGPTGSINNQDVFQNISEFHRQFSCGIKTIALISVAPIGVIQFGSTEKIPETFDFVNHIRYLFQHLATVDGQLSRCALTILNNEVYDPGSTVASAFSSGSPCPNYLINSILNNGGSNEMIEDIQLPMTTSSFQLQNQLQTASTADTEPILSTPNMHPQQVFSHFTSSSANNTTARNPTWSSPESGWTVFDQHKCSGMGMTESPNRATSIFHSHLSSGDKTLNFQGDTGLSSTYGINGMPTIIDNTVSAGCSSVLSYRYDTEEIPNVVDSIALSAGYNLGKVVEDQVSAILLNGNEDELPKESTAFQTFAPKVRPISDTVHSNPSCENNISQWISQLTEHGTNILGARVQENLSQAHGHETSKNNSVDNVSDVQKSVTSNINSLNDVCDEKVIATMQLPTDSDMFDNLELDFEQSHRMECWDDYVLPVVSGSHSSLSTGASECVSDFDGGPVADLQKAFFPDPRPEQLLEGVIRNTSDTRTSSEDPPSTSITTTRTAAEMIPMRDNQANFASSSCLGGSESNDDSSPKCRVEKTNMQKIWNETELKAQVGSWIDDSYSINMRGAASVHPKRHEKRAKATRKKGQSRESTWPRPNDRQQIQDRVKELRDIVPNGLKCSIDALLDRTIKHMLFLQSVTKYADKLKTVDERKMIGDENGVILKDDINGAGATLAFEVGSQSMVCPIIVEDVRPPGQMLIEMLCEEGGYFLEIADTVRGFGLTILKGVIEVRDDKMWACFIVEANRDITRMEIFLSLVQLLQHTSSGISSKNQLSKAVDGGVPMYTKYRQSPVVPPLGL